MEVLQPAVELFYLVRSGRVRSLWGTKVKQTRSSTFNLEQVLRILREFDVG